MNREKLMNICEQFIILKYAFHGAVEQIFRSDFGKDKKFRDNMIKYTKNTLLEVGIEMMKKDGKKESVDLFNELLSPTEKEREG